MDSQERMSTNTISYWKLDELADIIDTFEDLMAEKVNQGMKTAWDYSNLLLFAASKTIITAREILTLSIVGYPNGAFALSRNLYEQLITLSFLYNHKAEPDFQDYIEDYHLDFERQQNKYLRFRAERITNDKAEIDKLNAENERIKKHAHKKGKKNYWWAGCESFEQFALTAIDLESDPTMRSFLLSLHLRYREACTILHASSLGNQYYLGVDPCFVGVDTSPKPNAMGRPLLFMVETIMGIFGIISVDFDLKTKPGQQPLKDRLVTLENYYYSAI